jgi:hypothetical protein
MGIQDEFDLREEVGRIEAELDRIPRAVWTIKNLLHYRFIIYYTNQLSLSWKGSKFRNPGQPLRQLCRRYLKQLFL